MFFVRHMQLLLWEVLGQLMGQSSKVRLQLLKLSLQFVEIGFVEDSQDLGSLSAQTVVEVGSNMGMQAVQNIFQLSKNLLIYLDLLREREGFRD